MTERIDFMILFSGCDRLQFDYESKLSLCEYLGHSNALSAPVLKK